MSWAGRWVASTFIMRQKYRPSPDAPVAGGWRCSGTWGSPWKRRTPKDGATNCSPQPNKPPGPDRPLGGVTVQSVGPGTFRPLANSLAVARPEGPQFGLAQNGVQVQVLRGRAERVADDRGDLLQPVVAQGQQEHAQQRDQLGGAGHGNVCGGD